MLGMHCQVASRQRKECKGKRIRSFKIEKKDLVNGFHSFHSSLVESSELLSMLLKISGHICSVKHGDVHVDTKP